MYARVFTGKKAAMDIVRLRVYSNVYVCLHECRRANPLLSHMHYCCSCFEDWVGMSPVACVCVCVCVRERQRGCVCLSLSLSLSLSFSLRQT